MSIRKNYPDVEVNVFLMGDAVSCAVSGQQTHEGYYNIERMNRGLVTKKVDIACCGTCFNTGGLSDDYLVSGVKRGTMDNLSKWTASTEKVVTF
jgi:uncharacterized protein involved in oxidation of intracellular sulfur